ncbi:MAG: hypothetical protein RDA78_00575 [Roseibium sp.]|uniref:hypothetical protein n=1 Tax=Roseibium sp. TaxID=1936156 RepID=UPI003D9C5BF1
MVRSPTIFGFTLAIFLYSNTVLAGNVAVTIEGAFLVGEKATTINTRKRVDYLPIGTVVKVRECLPLVEVRRNRMMEYCKVESEFGIDGLLRKDLFRFLDESLLGVAVGDSEIEICNSSGNRYSSFSRSEGVYVANVKDLDEKYYEVELPWTEKKSGRRQRAAEVGWLRKSDVASGQVKLLKSSEDQMNVQQVLSDGLTLDVPIRSLKRVNQELLESIKSKSGSIPESQIYDTIQKKIDEVANALDIASEVIQCYSELKANIKTGFEIFGSGLGFEAEIKFSEAGNYFDYNAEFLINNGEHELTLLSFGNYRCSKSIRPRPVVMETFDLFADQSPNKGNSIPVVSNVSSTRRVLSPPTNGLPRMFRVNSRESYFSLRHELGEVLDENNLWYENMSEELRRVILHIVVSKVSTYTSN